jgi:uncharacterized membrane protein YhaH (DUF805 family)
MSWYTAVLKNYAGFDGRARRREYWMFNLVNGVIAIILDLIAIAAKSTPLLIVYLVYALAVFVPSLAVLIRRLHDTGRSGAWFWIGLIPLVGGIWLLVLTVLDGDSGANRYGPDPKAVGA